MTVHVRSVPGLSGERALRAAAFQYVALAAELKALRPEEWDLPTDCDRWDVGAVVCHLVGWMEGLGSPKEMLHQIRCAWARRHEFDNLLDAGNEVQVHDRRHFPPEQILEMLEAAYPRFLRIRARMSTWGRAVPVFDPIVVGPTNLAFYANVIFTRDALMHRMDIARACGKEIDQREEDGWVIVDVVKDWARRSQADAIVRLNGLEEIVTSDRPVFTVEGSISAFARVMTKRSGAEELEIAGDPATARATLAVGCPF